MDYVISMNGKNINLQMRANAAQSLLVLDRFDFLFTYVDTELVTSFLELTVMD